jgi:host factor-I protein
LDSKIAPQNIQDAFLNTARRERSSVTVYLVSGTKLQGRIKSFDKFSLLLESGAQEQLIFKHAISTIQHARRASGDLRNSSHEAAHTDGDGTTPDAGERTEA